MEIPKLECMKDILTTYAAYNTWANSRIHEVILKLPLTDVQKEMPSSFTTIQATLLHMYQAENIWWQRLLLAEKITPLQESLNQDIKALCNEMHTHSVKFHQWIGGKKEMYFSHVVQYQNLRKEYFKQPVFEILMHVFNHHTYHRGQLVNMFRQTGVDAIPSTDFIEWSRKKF
jgi:uncharacterized damage-inducible protein DinB